MKRFAIVTVVLAVSISAMRSASADVVALHQGANDPLTEGFGVWGFNGGGSAGPVSNDLGSPAWSITSLPPGSQQSAYLANLSLTNQAALLSDGFTMSLEARAVSGPVYASPTFSPIAAAIVGFFNGGPDLRYDLELGLDGRGNTVAILADSVSVNGDGSFNIPGASATVAGNGYHLYQLVFNPLSQTADLYIDGVDKIMGYAGHADNRFSGFYIGALDHGTGNFNLARLETGIHISGPTVPEPSTLLLSAATVLLGLGSFCRRSIGTRSG
jgi:hypothetical protein